MSARIAVIPGDGIGREVVAEASRVLQAIGGLVLEPLPWSADHYLETGVTIPAGGYDTLRSFDAILVGALGDPRVPDNRHARDILLGTRFALDLYVNYRPVRLLDDRLCPLKNRTRRDINFVVFRENTEGLYVGAGGRMRPDTDEEIAIQEEVNTYRGVHRIVRYAFDFAVGQRPSESLHGGQEQRDDARPRAVAARFQGTRAALPGRSRRRICTSTRWQCCSCKVPINSK